MRLYRLPLLLAFLSLFNACALLTADLKTPQISLVNVKPVQIGLIEQRFKLSLRVKNPNTVELPIRGMQYRLQLADADFAQGVSDQQIDVPAGGESQFDVDVKTDLTKMLRHLNALRKGPVAYRLDGNVALAMQALKIPFAYEGNIQLKF